MVLTFLFRVFSGLLVFTLLLPPVLSSAESQKSPAILAVEEVGGVVLPISGGGWEVGFHLRGRDLLADEGLKALKGLDEVKSLNLRDTKITSSGLAHLKYFTPRAVHPAVSAYGRQQPRRFSPVRCCTTVPTAPPGRRRTQVPTARACAEYEGCPPRQFMRVTTALSAERG